MNRRDFAISVCAGAAAMVVDKASAESDSLDPVSAARTLSEHRIADIASERSSDRYAHYVGRGAQGGPTAFGFSRNVCIVTTDTGVRGGGMSGAEPGEVRRLAGTRVSDLYDIEQGTAEVAMSIEIPLHDLVGNILGRPVYEVMGAKGSTHVPIYSSAIHFEDLEPWGKAEGISRLLSMCELDYDAGYRAFKLKIGRGFQCMAKEEGQKRDIEVTLAVRERFPDCKIIVDANNGYTCREFLDYVTGVKDADIYCIEEPFHEERDDVRRLREHMTKVDCHALIMEGESRGGQAPQQWRYGGYDHKHIENLLALAEEKLIDVINLDLSMGLSRWRKVMPELKAAGLRASPHTWAGTPRPYYCAHLAAGVGNIDIVEGIPGKASGMDYSAYRFEDGSLIVPNKPGFGIGLSF